MKSIIRVENIKKTFKVNKRANGLFGHIANLFIPKFEYIQAVQGISFEIDEGEAVGFIGANGAGKSTTIKMLSGILYPDEGSIEVLGYVPYKQRKAYVSNIGVIFGQKSQLSWDLPVIDSYELLRHIYRIPDKLYKENLKIFTELLDMSSFIEQPVRQLSLGQRMRADIGAALLHSPKIVFFDEPTIGLDVVAKERIREFVRYLNRECGITMIFTTHDMQDIEKICNRLILIDKGKKLYDGSVGELMDKYAVQRRVIVEFNADYEIEPIMNVVIHNKGSRKKEFIFSSDNLLLKDLISYLLEHYEINDLSIEKMDIESVVRQIYEGRIKVS